MTKRKVTNDSSSPADNASSSEPSKKKKLPTRHMYTNEQQRFVWYHRQIKKMGSKETHKYFHDYYNPEVGVSVDGLNQLVGRLRRTQPPEVISAVNLEPWASKTSADIVEKYESKKVPRTPEEPNRDGSKDAEESIPKRAPQSTPIPSEGDTLMGSEFGGQEGASAKDPSGGDHVKGTELGGQEEIIASQSCEHSNSTPLKLGSPSKPGRHMYTNEQHRFVWFYRHDLQMSPFQTYRMFQKYFNVPGMKQGTLNQLATRLNKQRIPGVVDVKHTEQWALGATDEAIKSEPASPKVEG